MTTHSATPGDDRERLSRRRILDVAIHLTDTEGIGRLTMRRLGSELGVEAMSLYNHVSSKDDVLGGMLEMVLGEIALPPAIPDWQAAIRTSAVSSHRTLLRHPWACPLMMRPNHVSAVRLRWMDAVLGCFRGAGFSAMLAHHAFHILDSHIVGFTLWLANLPVRGQDLEKLAADFLRTFPLGDYPHLAEHIDLHQRGVDDGKGTFEIGLDLLLEGLQRLRDSEP